MGNDTADTIRRAIAGDMRAQSALLRRFEPRVRLAVHRQLGGDVHAVVDTDDIVQSTLAAALADMPHLSFRGEDALLGWVLTIARHQVQMAARHHRAERRDVGRNQHLPTALPMAISATGPAERAERADEAQLVREAIARLDARDREIIDLHSFQGHGFEAIARELDLAGESSARERFRRDGDRVPG